MTRIHIDMLPVIAWMIFIFVMSSDLGSSSNSSEFFRTFIDWLEAYLSTQSFERLHLFLRKGCHLFEYAVLALLVLHSARISLCTMYVKWSWKAAFFSLVTASAYAATDELHQVFVPTRSASLNDVLIDSCGAILGLTFAFFWKRHLALRSRREACLAQA